MITKEEEIYKRIETKIGVLQDNWILECISILHPGLPFDESNLIQKITELIKENGYKLNRQVKSTIYLVKEDSYLAKFTYSIGSPSVSEEPISDINLTVNYTYTLPKLDSNRIPIQYSFT